MIDVSSSQVLQKAFNLASKKFKKNVTLTDLTKIWKAVGQVVDDEMSSKRGIQIPKFGTFTFNAAGKPIFIISDIFSRNSRSKQTKVSLAGYHVCGRVEPLVARRQKVSNRPGLSRPTRREGSGPRPARPSGSLARTRGCLMRPRHRPGHAAACPSGRPASRPGLAWGTGGKAVSLQGVKPKTPCV